MSYRAGLWRPRRMSISRRAPSEKLRGRLCQEETHWPNSSAAWNMTELMSVLQRSDRLVVRELSRLGRSLGVRRGRARPDLRSAPPRALPGARSSVRKLSGRPKGLPGASSRLEGQLHEHPRAQAEPLPCISARIWSVPYRTKNRIARCVGPHPDEVGKFISISVGSGPQTHNAPLSDPAGAARASYSACRARSSARAAAHRAGRSFARGG